jgi:prepilin-type N-terminal cleavage/methylation domain-containing protein
MMKMKKNGFTLVELLVVIAIIGVLMGILGPKLADLIGGSKKTKLKSIFNAWATQIHQYKAYYGYFPPFLYEKSEGEPIELKEFSEQFLSALKGKERKGAEWSSLENHIDQNEKGREFHSFTSDEFMENGQFIGEFLEIKILFDEDSSGNIELADTTVKDITDSLAADYSSEVLDESFSEKLLFIDESIVFYLTTYENVDEDEEWGTTNVFSWNIEKYLD